MPGPAWLLLPLWSCFGAERTERRRRIQQEKRQGFLPLLAAGSLLPNPSQGVSWAPSDCLWDAQLLVANSLMTLQMALFSQVASYLIFKAMY